MSSPMARATSRFARLWRPFWRRCRSPCWWPAAPPRALRAGQQAEQAQDYDRAVVEYTKALQGAPGQPGRSPVARPRQAARLARPLQPRPPAAQRRPARRGARRAADRLRAQSRPTATSTGARATSASQLRTKVAVTREGKTQLETLIERTRNLPPAGLDLPADARAAGLAHLPRRQHPRRLHRARRASPNVNMVFDPHVPRPAAHDRPAQQHARSGAAVGVGSHPQLLPRHRAAHHHRHPRHAGQAPRVRGRDRPHVLPEQRRPQGNDGPAADRRRPAGASRPMRRHQRHHRSRTRPSAWPPPARLITAIDKARPEVVIDVELLEVDRTRLREYGLQIASPGDPPAASTAPATINRDGLTLRDLRNLTQSDVFLTNLPGLFYRLLKPDSNTRTLANPQLRTSEGIAAQAGSASACRCRSPPSRRSPPAAWRSSRSRRSTTRTSA